MKSNYENDFMIQIAHIINPVKVKKNVDLYRAQPITFETLKVAKEYAKKKIEVGIYSAQYAEDEDLIPSFITKTNNLERSVFDSGCFVKKRKLPLLKDILNRLYKRSDAQYFIYSNVDIGVQPNFYAIVNQFIKQGYDAFVINRRTIPDHYQLIDQIPLMYAEVGKSHIGHDCFIFKRKAFPLFELGDVCVGTRLVGRVLLWNLLVQAKKFKEFKELHLTFHIGEDKKWKNEEFYDYDKFNVDEAEKAFNILSKRHNLNSLLDIKYPEYNIPFNDRKI